MGSWPTRKTWKDGGAGVLVRHSTGLMVRRTHPTLNFSSTGFQPVCRTGKMPVPPKTFVSGSQAPAWELHCRQSSCFARESSILLRHVPQGGAWERGKGGMRCAFPPYGLRATHEKARRAGVLPRHSTGLMVRRTHPTKNFSEQGTVNCTKRPNSSGAGELTSLGKMIIISI